MAPPDRSDEPRSSESDQVLERLCLRPDFDTRLSHNAGRLASWVEWLEHPEEHQYDRTVIYPDGTRREEPGPVSEANPTPGHYDPVELPFESVVAQYNLDQYLDGMAAFATQEVERPDSVLSLGAAAMRNVWWLGDKYMVKLVQEFPDKSEWSGAAAEKASTFIGDMGVIVTQMNKIAKEFVDIAPHYAVIVKTARDNLDQAAADLVTAFEEKFHTKPPEISIDIVGIALSAITAGAVTYMTAGAILPLIKDSFITAAWSATFTEAAKTVLSDKKSQGMVHGFLWSELAQTYMRAQADILNDAITSINSLNSKIEELIGQFNSDIAPFLEEYAG